MANELKLKANPYGISDFQLLRQDNYYFIDKTAFFRIIEDKGRYLFFIRPRRFGKSLFLSMFETYYDVSIKDRFGQYFDGLDIARDPTPERNTYLILKFNFAMLDANLDRVEESFLEKVKESVLTFLKKYHHLLTIDLQAVTQRIESLNSPAMVLNKILFYCGELKHKLYVVIDEYDNFANTILSSRGEKDYHSLVKDEGFFRSFFNVLKGGTTGSNAPISRLFISGVSPITMDDVTSGFNIGETISLDADINEILGFTYPEVETMIDYYRQHCSIPHSTPELMDLLSLWYNGYRFSKRARQEVFNPTQVLYFLKEYLKGSELPEEFVDENLRIDYKKIQQLIIIDRKISLNSNGNFSTMNRIIETGFIESRIVKSFPVRNITNPNNFISLLYYFGLLTITGVSDDNTPILKIPNETIKRLFFDYIRETYEEIDIFTLDLDKYATLIKAMAQKKQWEPLITFIAAKMKESVGLRDLLSSEKAIQTFINVYLGLNDYYLVHSEKELHLGYADLVLEPFLVKHPTTQYSYIIEIKYLKPDLARKKGFREKVTAIRTEAEQQLLNYSLDEKFRKTIGQTTLVKCVLVFCGLRLVDFTEVGSLKEK